jgi:BMFP domain-containing protein YqiC
MKFKKETKDKLADLEARVEALEESDSDSEE